MTERYLDSSEITVALPRTKAHRAILKPVPSQPAKRPAVVYGGERVAVVAVAHTDIDGWYQAAIIAPDGRRTALAWWHAPSGLLCDRWDTY